MSITTATTTDVSALDLLPTDIEDSLRETVRDLVAARAGAGQAVYDGDRDAADALWAALAEDLGLAGLLVPEEFGGAGATAREAATVLRELGRAAAPVPFLTSAVIATRALLRSLDGPGDGAVRDLLTRVATGETRVAVALPWHLDRWTGESGVSVADGVLTGRLDGVADAAGADLLLVPTGHGPGAELYAVERDAVTVTEVPSFDMSRPLADLRLDGAAGTLLASGTGAVEAIDRALLEGVALMASEQTGLMDWCLATTVDYLGVRRQFGRIVGGFQALKHRMADMHVALVGAEAAARYAAVVLAEESPDVEIAAHVAAAACGPAAVDLAEECVQLHGGIGMTWEHDAHLRLKRAVSDDLALGTAATHRARLAELLGFDTP